MGVSLYRDHVCKPSVKPGGSSWISQPLSIIVKSRAR